MILRTYQYLINIFSVCLLACDCIITYIHHHNYSKEFSYVVKSTINYNIKVTGRTYYLYFTGRLNPNPNTTA